MSTKIYTKTGDTGTTSLLGGTKVSKSNIRIETYGTVDELNSYIGLVSDNCEDDLSKIVLKEIQNNLFVIGSLLACDPDKDIKMKLPELKEEAAETLEKEIDKMNEVLPAMSFFILPGGSVAISTTHIARCVCRRAERWCVNMQEHNLKIDGLVIKYLNRLSDYLFVLARYIGHITKVPENKWNPL